MECPASTNIVPSKEQTKPVLDGELETSKLSSSPISSKDVTNETNESSHQERKSPKKYCKITNEQRKEIVDALENKGQKIRQIAERLGINYSTIKSIYLVYKKEGRVKKKGSKKLLEKEKKQASLQTNSQLLEATDNNKKNLDLSFQIPNQAKESFEGPDKLKELHDRLLESKSGKRKQLEDIYNASVRKEIHNISTNNTLPENYPISTSFYETKPLKISDENIIQQGQAPLSYQGLPNTINMQNLPQRSYFMLAGDSSSMQQNFIFQQAPIQPMMLMNSQSMFQNNPTNFFPQPMQNIMIGDPTQTFNINNPHAESMNIKHINTTESSDSRQESQTTQIYAPMMPTNQVQYYMMPINNNNMGKQVNYPQANQVQYMQPVMYMMPSIAPTQTNFPGQAFFYNGNMISQQNAFIFNGENQNQKTNFSQNQILPEDNRSNSQS